MGAPLVNVIKSRRGWHAIDNVLERWCDFSSWQDAMRYADQLARSYRVEIERLPNDMRVRVKARRGLL